MANEFKHKDPGAELTQDEYIAACGDGHIFACQATGDLIYADSSTVLKKLARGSTTQMLQIASCKPAWTSTPSLGTTSWCNMNHAHGAGNSGGTVCANVLAGTTLKSCVVTSSLTTVGALNSGSISCGFGAIDNGSSAITTTGLISGGSLDIDNVLINGTTIGHTCDTDLMTVGNACLTIKGAVTVGVDDTGHDVKFFGAAAGAYMLYDQSCDQLEIRGASADATTSTGKLLLSTSLTNVNANDVIGSINFQAPAEAGGTDAIAIAAGIRAVAQATFTCAVNSTDLIFYTGHSEAATEKFRFTSQGEIGIGGANYGNDGQVLTSGGAGAAPAWECGGVGCGPLRIANGAACAPAYSFSGDTNSGFYHTGTADTIELIAGGGGSLRLDSDSKVYIKETANSKMDRGLTINMGGNSNEILTFKSSDVGHTMLNTTEADTFGFISKYQAAGGGLRINGYMDGDVTAANENSAIAIAGFVQDAANTDKCGSANGIVTIDAQIRSGCSSTNVNSDGNILTIRDCTSTRFIFDKEGTAHAEVGTATFDDYCDVELLRGFLATTCDQYKQNYVDKFGQDLMYNQEWYEENKLIGRNSIHWEERECGKMQQRAMVNFTGLAMLHHSTIIQLSDRVNARLDDIDTQLKALTEGK